MRILQRNRGLRGEQSQQLDRFLIEVIDMVALTIEHSDHFVANHQRNSEFRTGGLRGTDVTWILAHVGSIDRLLFRYRGPGDSLVGSEADLVLAGIPTDLRANAKLLGLLVEQEDGDVRELKVIARNGQDPLQHLVQIKSREHGLAGVIQDRNFWHSSQILSSRMVMIEGAQSNRQVRKRG